MPFVGTSIDKLENNKKKNQNKRIKEINIYVDLQTKGFFSSATLSPFSSRILSTLLEGFPCFVDATALLPGSLLSGNIFRMIPMAMSNSPVPCCSVNGFVNIMYDSNSVTAFLAVVT